LARRQSLARASLPPSSLPTATDGGQRATALTTGRLHVRRAKSGATSVHPIGARDSRALRRLQRETKTHVFVSERGAPLSVAGYQRMIAKAGEAAGVLVPHSQPHAAPTAAATSSPTTARTRGHPALPRPSLHCLDGPLHGVGAGSVQAISGRTSVLKIALVRAV
jgi:hypothetical protein